MTDFRLVPDGDLEPDPSGRHTWQVTGARPRLRVTGTPKPVGWFRLRARYRADDTHPGEPLGPQLRLAGLAGPVSSVSRSLALRRDRIDRILYLPDDAEELFVDLPITARAFDLDDFSLAPIGQTAAAARMAAAVASTARLGSHATGSLFSRGWESARAEGVGGLRAQLVADYEAVQRRGAGLVAIPYREWLELHGVRTAADDAAIDAEIAAMVDPPVISVVVPVYDTPPELLAACIDSVRTQRYPHWQLCLANDASPAEHIRQQLDDAAAADERIVVVHRRENGHIAAASNSALELATGEFVALLDHDDELPDIALYLVARDLLAHPDTDLAYTDEDKIGEHGRRYDPHFKPAYNPELLLGQNYFSHLTTMRRTLVAEVGGFREGFEGSQDYDLFLRVVGRSGPDRIRHIPHVAYHWRAIEGSTAKETGAKGYAEDAALKALREHVPADWSVGPASAPTSYRCDPPLPDPLPLVSVIIPTRNGWDLLAQCMDGLARSTYDNIEVIVVDNGSDDPAALAGMAGMAAEGRATIVRHDAPFNYSEINNIGVEHSSGELLCLLNNDIEVIETGWLEAMVRHAVRCDVGAVGAKLLYGDGTIQHAGVILGLGGVAGHGHRRFPGDGYGYFSRLGLTHQAGAVTAACMVLRREVFDEVGGLDAESFGVAFNDVDLCLRIGEAGYRIIWEPQALLYHHESVSRGAEDTPEKQARFSAEVHAMLDRWGDALLRDPAYNPNLALDADAFTLAREPRVVPPWRARPTPADRD